MKHALSRLIKIHATVIALIISTLLMVGCESDDNSTTRSVDLINLSSYNLIFDLKVKGPLEGTVTVDAGKATIARLYFRNGKESRISFRNIPAGLSGSVVVHIHRLSVTITDDDLRAESGGE